MIFNRSSQSKLNRKPKSLDSGKKNIGSLEQLEDRRLFSAWSPQAVALGQDLLAQQYPGITGAGETVVVIDLGTDTNHPQIAGKFVATWNFENGTADVSPVDGGEDGHGTATVGEVGSRLHQAVDGLTQGIAPGANLIALKATGTYQEQLAFDWVIAHRAQYNIVGVEWADPLGGTTSFQYDANGLRTQKVDSAGTTNYLARSNFI